MGGRTLKKAKTRRYNREEFDTVSKEVVETIERTFKRASTPLFYHNKETFGDIDVIVDISGHEDLNIRNYLSVFFDPTEIFHNGNCYSFDHKEVQVDFMCVDGEHYDSNYHYLAFNDLGNYIGRIAHRLGLKYGAEGLWYNHYINGQNVDKVMISKDYREIFKFLDLDYDRWLEGFDELEDTFEFVLASKYFDSDMFQLKNLNRINRERNLKRASYMSFLEWIDTNHPRVDGEVLSGNLFKIVDEFFPEANFNLKIKEIEYLVAKKQYVNAKFNGGMVMLRYGLEGKEIGDALKTFKRSIESEGFSFEHYILSESQVNIFIEFENLLDLDYDYK